MPAAARVLRQRLPESFAARRIAGRVRPPSGRRSRAPEAPVGLKLEVTYACNLRCGFCYTDSPRHTLARTAELDDDAVLAIVDEAIEIGILEAVVTGGEPFLRRELTLEAMRRLDRAGVGVTLNTNGWFVDAALARELAEVRSLHVHVSVDGATPELHDRSRGIPGSWRRAVGAIDHLIAHGVAVHGVHVVTPDNEHAVVEYLDAMWTLGLRSLRATPVIPTGAAARGGRWSTSRTALDAALAEHRARRGDGMTVTLQEGSAAPLAVRDQLAPAALLVRPDGRVRIDSLHPFTFGRADQDGVATCWQRIVEGWRDPSIGRWAGSLRKTSDLAEGAVVPYLDDDPAVGAPAAGAGRSVAQRNASAEQPVPAATPARDAIADPAASLTAARATVRGLALARRYRHGPIRVGGDPRDAYVRNVATGAFKRLNPSAAAVLEAFAQPTRLADAAAALAGRHPDVERERVEDDVLAFVRDLTGSGFLVCPEAVHPATPGRASLPDLPGEGVAVAGP